jgi:hypothetical protein
MNMQTAINSQNTQQVDPLPPEVVALCTLLARIMYRCLTERNPRIMALLDLPTVQGSEVTNEQAA